MNKPGLTEDTADGVLATAAHGWALCVGAGTSLPAFPDWNALVGRLIARSVGADAAALSQSLGEMFTADALIQAASTRSGLSSGEFAKQLTEELYGDFLAGFDPATRATVVEAMAAQRPGELAVPQWRRFLEALDQRWGDRMSCLPLAELVSETLGTARAPAAILSFNAEPLLLAALHAHQACASPAGVGVPQRLDRVVRGISNRATNRVPYVFCHGLLPVPGARVTKHAASPDKLVFSEASYLQLAGTVYSWQATSFLETCSARRVVFVGLSLSDANMRRWLSWVHDSRAQELEQIGHGDAVSTQHYWLSADPGDSRLRAWIEASVAHLGVRLVWLKQWANIGPVLRRMLGPLRP